MVPDYQVIINIGSIKVWGFKAELLDSIFWQDPVGQGLFAVGEGSQDAADAAVVVQVARSVDVCRT